VTRVVVLESVFLQILAAALSLQSNTTHDITNKSQAPEDGCTNIRNMLSIK